LSARAAPPPVVDDAASQVTMTNTANPKQSGENQTQSNTVPGLTLARVCTRCGHVCIPTGGVSRCTHCGSGMRVVVCGVCQEPVRGLYKACLSCGHVAHLNCVRALMAAFAEDRQVTEGDDGYGVAFDECETGCGCRCDAYGCMEVQVEEEKKEEKVETVRKRGSVSARRKAGIS